MNETPPTSSRWVTITLSVWMTVVTLALVSGVVHFWPKAVPVTEGGAHAPPAGNTATDGQQPKASTSPSPQATNPPSQPPGTPDVNAAKTSLPEPRVIIMLILLLGAAGAQIHALQSFADFVGNGSFTDRWAFWYMKRPLIGALVALVAYSALDGGFVGAESMLVRAPGNLWGLAALCLCSGLFSRLVTDKLYEVMSTLLAVKAENKQTRSDKMDDPASSLTTPPKLLKLEPSQVSLAKPVAVKITGENFTQACKLMLDGKETAHRFVSATEIQLAAEVHAKKGTVKVTVRGENSTKDSPEALELVVND